MKMLILINFNDHLYFDKIWYYNYYKLIAKLIKDIICVK